jgi:hypothetical protein
MLYTQQPSSSISNCISKRFSTPTTDARQKIIPAPLFNLDIPRKICHNLHDMRNLDAPPCAIKPPKRRYSASDALRVKEPGNVVRFRALVRLFRLSPTDVARATGFSRSYISRILSPNDDFTGSPEFFRSLETKLGTVIAGRTAQYFTIPAVSVQRARDVLNCGIIPSVSAVSSSCLRHTILPGSAR